MTKREEFETLAQERVSDVLDSKDTIINYVKAGIAALEEDEQDVELIQDIGISIQGMINSSAFYEPNGKLEEINDDLLSFEDFNRVTDNKEEIETTFKNFKEYLKSLPEKLEKVL